MAATDSNPLVRAAVALLDGNEVVSVDLQVRWASHDDPQLLEALARYRFLAETPARLLAAESTVDVVSALADNQAVPAAVALVLVERGWGVAVAASTTDPAVFDVAVRRAVDTVANRAVLASSEPVSARTGTLLDSPLMTAEHRWLLADHLAEAARMLDPTMLSRVGVGRAVWVLCGAGGSAEEVPPLPVDDVIAWLNKVDAVEFRRRVAVQASGRLRFDSQWLTWVLDETIFGPQSAADAAAGHKVEVLSAVVQAASALKAFVDFPTRDRLRDFLVDGRPPGPAIEHLTRTFPPPPRSVADEAALIEAAATATDPEVLAGIWERERRDMPVEAAQALVANPATPSEVALDVVTVCLRHSLTDATFAARGFDEEFGWRLAVSVPGSLARIDDRELAARLALRAINEVAVSGRRDRPRPGEFASGSLLPLVPETSWGDLLWSAVAAMTDAVAGASGPDVLAVWLGRLFTERFTSPEHWDVVEELCAGDFTGTVDELVDTVLRV